MFIRTLVLSLSSLIACNASAATLFTDDFNSNTPGLSTTPSGWTVSDGTVDVIGVGTSWNYFPANGLFVDLDGSTGEAGKLSREFNLTAGEQYVVSFDLAGNQRNADIEKVTVNFGDRSNIYTPTQSQGFTSYALAFIPAASGSYKLSFQDDSHDNVGALLDNVTVTSVPVPAAVWLLGSGLLGLMGVRRKQS